MYPHERSLVKKYGDKFAIVGVNSDKKERYLKAIENEDITWRSFWDGGSTGGPIAREWMVRGWPTIYVLDHNGIIRGKQIRGAKLDELLDKLVAEVPDGEGSSADAESSGE